MSSIKVTARCTKDGWIFEGDGKTAGPYWSANPPIVEVAEKLKIDPKRVYEAILDSYQKELTLDELDEILDSTVKKDRPSKLIVFLGMLLAQTEEDQLNCALLAESAAGKSYIPLELSEYFPENEKRIYAGASPTAFFHEVGEWDEECKIIRVNLEKKILLFLDQPHWQLMEKLRPLLSHDCKRLIYKITDKKEKKGLLTKTVEIIGFPTVIFCTAKGTLEEQEKTRIWLLSPETSEEKILEALNLLGVKESDRNGFKKFIEEHPQRRWLKTRIEMIRRTGISEVIIPNNESVLQRFITNRSGLKPRDTRDFSRLLRLIKAHALLNAFTRVRINESTILATEADIEGAWNLYEEVSEANELGLPPNHLKIFKEVVEPICLPAQGCLRKEILLKFRLVFHRYLSPRTLAEEILPSLEAAGLIYQEADVNDRRLMRIFLAKPMKIYPDEQGGKQPQNSPLSRSLSREFKNTLLSFGVYSFSSSRGGDYPA